MSRHLDQALTPALEERRSQSLYRQRAVVDSPQQVHLKKDGRDVISFCSNDYLGLANHPKVQEAFIQAARKFGVGGGASHLVCGHSTLHHELEEALAEFTQRPRALLFSTGYMANLGVINALTRRGDVVFEDRLNHASLIDGALLSAGEMKRFRHNDVSQLDQLLSQEQNESQRKLIVVDGVFSMDGDYANLPELSALANKHNAWLMVDDAHGLGCVGENGRGSLEHFNLGVEDTPILMGTLGKAIGSFGAFVAGSEALIESLIQFGRTYIYTTAMPPAVAAASLASLRIIQEEPERRQNLSTLIQYFREQSADLPVELMPSETAIQPLVLGDAQRAVRVSDALMEKGFWVSAIRPPTVPQGTARLRVTLSAEHTKADVDALLTCLKEVLHEHA